MNAPAQISRPRKMRKLPALLAAGAMTISIFAISADPAEAAGNVYVGYTSCVQGSARSALNATGTQTHTLYQHGIKRSKTFASTSRPQTRTWYPGLNPVTGGHLYTTGNLNWGNVVCAD